MAAFRDAMDDDFGTPDAMSVVFTVARDTNTAIDRGDRDRAASGLATVRELTGAARGGPLAGGTPVVLASGQSYPWGIAIDALNVYWPTFVASGNVMLYLVRAVLSV